MSLQTISSITMVKFNVGLGLTQLRTENTSREHISSMITYEDLLGSCKATACFLNAGKCL